MPAIPFPCPKCSEPIHTHEHVDGLREQFMTTFKEEVEDGGAAGSNERGPALEYLHRFKELLGSLESENPITDIMDLGRIIAILELKWGIHIEYSIIYPEVPALYGKGIGEMLDESNKVTPHD